jgi:nucleoside-diphosphate-sugar epimerase
MAAAIRMVLGCGYLGQRVAEHWRRDGTRVIVGTRRPERAARLAAEGFEARVLDVTQPDTLGRLPPLDTLLFAVAYDPSSLASQQAVCVDGLLHVLGAIDTLTDRLIYISTTGVYGQQNHEWVDERSTCDPRRAGGRCYLQAEQRLQAHRWGSQSVILRLAGLYGPGRVPYLDRLRSNQPLPVDPAGYLNLIHVDDAVRVVLASGKCELPNLFVVADGSPVLRADYYREVGSWVGREPTFGPPDPLSPQAQRALASKRIRNAKLVQQLGVTLQYPSYREGLRAILGGEPADRP